MTNTLTSKEFKIAAALVKQFTSPQQYKALNDNVHGEEGQFFVDKIIEIGNILATMPKIYEQSKKKHAAVAYLHYYIGSCDWYITEKDKLPDQLQAFGLANLGFGSELGYISIVELCANDVELDLYYTPQTIVDIQAMET
jgi:hypothetical protein